jgi:proton-translocating NAD(P)+ transhydrogenase subunit alpha
MPLITEITIFVLAAFVGFEVISKVPTTLHTPLMSQTNAIHGIVLLGGLIVVGLSDFWLDNLIGTIAIFFGTINIVGGFMVTDRMLGMFVRKPKPPASSATSEPRASDQPAEPAAGAGGSQEGRGSGDSDEASPEDR